MQKITAFGSRILAGTYFGDADLNQEVDFSDFLALSRPFRRTGWLGRRRLRRVSGDVQFNDFLLLADNFGNQPMVSFAIPEPTGGPESLA